MSFVKRRIDVTITLGTGQFGDGKGNTVTLTGLRIDCAIATVIQDAQGILQCRIYGLPLATMNQLTTIGPIRDQNRNNQILVAAGDDGQALSTVYTGVIDSAFAEFNNADAVLNITARSALIAAVKPVAASSYVGSTSVSVIMFDLATLAGFSLKDNGVSVQLSNPYFPGSALQQIRECAKAANIKYVIDKGVLEIWPQGGSRSGKIPTISADNGMIGYPQFNSKGLHVETQFNPDLQAGGKLKIESTLTAASEGTWQIFQVSLNLASETPGGPWKSICECQPIGNQQ